MDLVGVAYVLMGVIGLASELALPLVLVGEHIGSLVLISIISICVQLVIIIIIIIIVV